MIHNVDSVGTLYLDKEVRGSCIPAADGRLAEVIPRDLIRDVGPHQHTDLQEQERDQTAMTKPLA
jgi:hypothetical protein